MNCVSANKNNYNKQRLVNYDINKHKDIYVVWGVIKLKNFPYNYDVDMFCMSHN